MYLALVLALAAGSVQGIATTEGAPLPGCTVTLTSSAGRSTTISDSQGAYRFDSVAPGSYELLFELTGLESVQRSIEVAEGMNDQPPAEVPLSATAEAITIVCTIRTCQNGAPSSPWERPACSDEALVDALIESMERGDRSAVALLRSRHERAETYAEKHRIAGALLRNVPDDSRYWNELLEHARNAVRFASDGGAHSEEFVQWCQERLYEPAHYAAMANDAFGRVAQDRRARSLDLEALERGVFSLAPVAIAGLAVRRDLTALPAIERALQRHDESAVDLEFAVYTLAFFGHERADELAYRYLQEEDREASVEARNPQPCW